MLTDDYFSSDSAVITASIATSLNSTITIDTGHNSILSGYVYDIFNFNNIRHIVCVKFSFSNWASTSESQIMSYRMQILQQFHLGKAS